MYWLCSKTCKTSHVLVAIILDNSNDIDKDTVGISTKETAYFSCWLENRRFFLVFFLLFFFCHTIICVDKIAQLWWIKKDSAAVCNFYHQSFARGLEKISLWLLKQPAVYLPCYALVHNIVKKKWGFAWNYNCQLLLVDCFHFLSSTRSKEPDSNGP